MDKYQYSKDGREIYKSSFATIRREAKLSHFSPEEERVAVRMIHACGMVELAEEIVFSPKAAKAGISALARGAPILCDASMVASGVTRARLPANNKVICTLDAPGITKLSANLQTTRSAAALEYWQEELEGAVIAIGNSPTALFHLLEMLAHGAPNPALIIGVPVGFVGAAESKQALLDRSELASIVVRGRKGGSAMAAAAINALASASE